MRRRTPFLIACVLSLLSPLAGAQSINQYNESVAYGFNGTTDINWSVNWTYPIGSNPSTRGMNTYAKAFGYFLVNGQQVQANDVQLAQYTFPGTFSPGTTSKYWNGKVCLWFEAQKPAGATHLYWKIRINSTVYWNGPYNFLTDNWTSLDWTVHTY